MSARKYKRYPAYRDSGVEWLGEIPSHWRFAKTTWLFTIGSGTTPSSENPNFYGGATPWITTSELRESVILSPEKYVTDEALRAHSSLKVHPKGSVAVAMYGATIGRLGIFGVAAAVNQACCVFSKARGIEQKYWFYWLQMRRPYLISLGYGGGQPNLSQDLLRSIRVSIPPVPEQRAIATFLNRETARIDLLMSMKERLIELLQEQRAALITRAVTKGLDPNVPMKDSGVDWLGEIPAHWEVSRLKQTVTGIEQGWSPLCENRQAGEGEWGVLKVGCVNGENFDESEHKALPSDLQAIPAYEIRCGDILMSRANTRELLGSAVLVSKVRARLLLCDKLYRLRVSFGQVLPVFVVQVLASRSIRFQLEREATGASASMQNISQETISNLMFALPPINEQQAITAFINRETKAIDALVATIHEAVDVLIELRSSLISAAVTGKIDVREAVA